MLSMELRPVVSDAASRSRGEVIVVAGIGACGGGSGGALGDLDWPPDWMGCVLADGACHCVLNSPLSAFCVQLSR